VEAGSAKSSIVHDKIIAHALYRRSVLSGSMWRTLNALHGLVEAELERALDGLSLVEYTVLDALSEQDERHLRMHEVARTTALSSSAATRLVNRLETRGLIARVLCDDDRRGIYSELTDAGREVLEAARPAHDEALARTLERAAAEPELAPLVAALRAPVQPTRSRA
jgi:DNA-binding MarR family transcriptional regulator